MAARGPVVSVSVDLDEVACYHEIHGLEDARARASRAVVTHAVPRLLELFERSRVPATFFVVGSSLDELGARAARQLVEAGHELGNHTASHRYDLLALGPEAREREVRLGAEAIEAATGLAPVGFRAPGYNVDDALLRLLSEQGYEYDSSVFPCPPYFLAKAAVMGAMRLAGRRSRSLLGPPETLLAPTEPYLVDGPFWRPASRGLVELPIAVLPISRIPFIGTTLSLAGPRAAAGLARLAAGRRFLALELHGIDLLDATDEGLGPLVRHQPDLGVPLARKLEVFEATFAALARARAELLPCREAARRVAREAGGAS